MESKVMCPHCGLNDKIIKVSALVASQTHETSPYSSQASVLAQSLMPPEKPELKVRATGAIMGPHRKSCLGELGFYANVLFFGLIGIALIFGASSARNSGFLFILGFGALGFTAYYFWSSQKKLQNAESKLEEPTRRWVKALQQWEQLFYCYRDDVVFNPNNKKTASPRSVYQLYE